MVDLVCGTATDHGDISMSTAEIKSICVTMIAGGLDTTPACILLGVAILSGPQGVSLQKALVEDIHKTYGDGNAWGGCLHDEKAEYVMAFCKEVLRFWTVIPMSLPRVSIKDVVWQGATIPAGTTFLMVREPIPTWFIGDPTSPCYTRQSIYIPRCHGCRGIC